MFQKISYFNLFFAVVYLLVYLKDGTPNSTIGIFMIIVFNWLGLRSYQIHDYQWKIWHYLVGVWSLYYAGFVGYGAINVLSSAIEYEFMSNDTRTFLVLSFVFVIAVIVQFMSYLTLYLKNK